MGDRPTPGRIRREVERMSDWQIAEKIREQAEAGKVVHLLPETALRVYRAIRFFVNYSAGKQGEYTVTSWYPKAQGGGPKRDFGTLNQHDAAIGAFEEVVKHFPDEIITVRERCRPLRQHNRERDEDYPGR